MDTVDANLWSIVAFWHPFLVAAALHKHLHSAHTHTGYHKEQLSRLVLPPMLCVPPGHQLPHVYTVETTPLLPSL